jgi:predicted transcriptional regulator
MRQRNIKLDKNGIKVVNFFMQNRESELTADEVSRKFKIDEVDAGIILNSLEKAGFLKGEGRGLNYYYKVSDDVLATQINQSENAQEGNDDDTTRYIG